MLLGIACRFYNLKWDEGAHIHPDERFVVMTVEKLKAPASLNEYFNTNESGLNPFHTGTDLFVYGQLPLNLCKWLVLRWPGSGGAPNADNYNDILIVGRFLSALFDAGAVLLVAFIGWKMGGLLSGALAGALIALVPLHIQQSHFFTVDNFATFFLVASFASLICVPKANDKTLVLSGMCFGAACACKISAALFGAVFPFWAILLFGKPAWKRALLSLVIIFSVGFFTFRCLHPIAFRGANGLLFGLLDIRLPQPEFHGAKQVSFWDSFAEQAAISRGDSDPPWNWQWLGHKNYIWPLQNLALWALGVPLLVAGIAGIGLSFRCWRDISPHSRHLLVAALWCLIVFGYYGGQYSKFTRYYLVMTPFLCLLAAGFLIEVVRRYRTQWSYAVAASVPLGTACWCLAVTSIYARPHTRMEATRWIWDNIAPGTLVATETSWDDALPIGDVRGLVQVNLELFDLDDRRKRAAMLDKLDQSEWIFMSSNHTRGIVTRVPQRWPLTTAFYDSLFDGRLGFSLEKEWTSYPRLFGVRFPDDAREESLWLYDHPHVWLWRKTSAWSKQKASALLSENLCDKADSRPLNGWLK